MPLKTTKSLIVFFALAAIPVHAGGDNFVHGLWGTAAQCAQELIKPGGTRLAEPFEIGPEWLRQGDIWCKLTWFDPQERAQGIFIGARARCGEDSLQGFWLGMAFDRSGDAEQLSLIWNENLVNGPLERCAVPKVN